MATLPSDLVNIPSFEPLQPSDATMTIDTTDWEIDQLLSQIPDLPMFAHKFLTFLGLLKLPLLFLDPRGM